MAHDISSNWGGLLLIVAAVVGQFLNAMRKGKPPTPPVRTEAKPRYRPVVLPQHPGPPTPYRPSDLRIPPAPLPQPVRDLFREELSIPPAYVPSEPEPVERPVEVLRAAAAVPPAPRHGTALDRLRLNTRDDWQRAILLSEVLQPPLALRG